MQRSWMAYISAGLGAAALLGVMSFHFPTLLTSRDFRAVYTEGFARNLLLLGLVLSFTFGTVAVLRRRSVKVALALPLASCAAPGIHGRELRHPPVARGHAHAHLQ